MMAGGEFWLSGDLRDQRRSPAEETESDEEDYYYLAGLTRRMAYAFLHDDEDPMSTDYPKVKTMAGSPQSTLCDVGIWGGPRNGSPNGPPSKVSSPPVTGLEQHKEDAWDQILTAAASQVVRLRLNERAPHQHKFQGRGLLGPPAKLSPPAIKNAAMYHSRPLHTQQLQNERLKQIEMFYQLKQQQLLKHQIMSARCGGGFGEDRSARPQCFPSSPWTTSNRRQTHPAQPQHRRHGSGLVRDGFLSLPAGARKQSTGTGVFLPRRPGDQSTNRQRKPDGVIQAPSLNVDDMGAYPLLPGGFLVDSDSVVGRGNRFVDRQRRYAPPTAVPDIDNLRLPAEWTY